MPNPLFGQGGRYYADRADNTDYADQRSPDDGSRI